MWKTGLHRPPPDEAVPSRSKCASWPGGIRRPVGLETPCHLGQEGPCGRGAAGPGPCPSLAGTESKPNTRNAGPASLFRGRGLGARGPGHSPMGSGKCYRPQGATGRPGPDSARGPETAGKPPGRPGSGTSRRGRQGTAPPGPSRAAVRAAAGLRVGEHGGRRGHAPTAPGEPRGSRPGKSSPLHCPRRLRGPSGGVLAASRVRAPGPDSSRCPSPTLPAAEGLAQGSHTPGRRPVLKMNPLDGTAAPEMPPLWSARPLPPPFVDQKRPAQAPEASSPAFPVGVGSSGCGVRGAEQRRLSASASASASGTGSLSGGSRD